MHGNLSLFWVFTNIFHMTNLTADRRDTRCAIRHRVKVQLLLMMPPEILEDSKDKKTSVYLKLHLFGYIDGKTSILPSHSYL